MPEDYASKAQKKRKAATRNNVRKAPARPKARWPWLASGFVLGIMTVVLFQRWDNPQQDIVQTIDDFAGKDAPKSIKPRFDFYRALRDAEVIAPDVEQNPVRGSHTNGDIFLLQVGSFRDTRDADSLRARLLLLNLDAHVEAASGASSGTWHRVIVGPFISQSKLAKARSTLLQNGIDNLVLKRKDDS